MSTYCYPYWFAIGYSIGLPCLTISLTQHTHTQTEVKSLKARIAELETALSHMNQVCQGNIHFKDHPLLLATLDIGLPCLDHHVLLTSPPSPSTDTTHL